MCAGEPVSMSAVSLPGSVTHNPAGTAENHLSAVGATIAVAQGNCRGFPGETLEAVGLLLAEAPTSGYLAGEIPVSWRRCRGGALVPVPLAAWVLAARG